MPLTGPPARLAVPLLVLLTPAIAALAAFQLAAGWQLTPPEVVGPSVGSSCWGALPRAGRARVRPAGAGWHCGRGRWG